MEYINEDREEALLEQTLNKNENDINEMMFILRESIRHFISSRVCGSTEDEPYECDILVGEEEAQGLSEAEKIRYDRIFEENGVFFDELVKGIKTGNACCVVKELVTLPNSDRDLLTYEDILDSARALDERIVYDDMFYVLTASKDIITLYEYCKVEDMLGDTLEEGDEVLWADPDDSARDLNRTWEVYEIHSTELVKISTGKVGKRGYSEAEVPPCELVKKSSIIHVEYDAGCGSMG